MKALITGAGGLVGSAACRKLLAQDWDVAGIDNNMRQKFFGSEGSTEEAILELNGTDWYYHYNVDIRDSNAINEIVEFEKPDLIIHTAAQPSHDWAAKDPHTDFGVNAVGTLNLLQAAREHCIDTPFCHISTSKVYGDRPNLLPFELVGNRIDLHNRHVFYNGIDTSMPVDQCLHSLFGVSKLSGDLLVQEYGRYFQMPTLILRPGCVTGANHSSVELHGFLSYLMKCAATRKKYTVYGYDGLQVRCNIHADDLVDACLTYAKKPKTLGIPFNIGGGRKSACSVLEAIKEAEIIADKYMEYGIVEANRIGDHMWWISDNSEFQKYYDWEPKWSVSSLLMDIYNGL